MADGHFVCAPFIPGVHSLGCAEIICNLLLGSVMIFSEISDSCSILHGSAFVNCFLERTE